MRQCFLSVGCLLMMVLMAACGEVTPADGDTFPVTQSKNGRAYLCEASVSCGAFPDMATCMESFPEPCSPACGKAYDDYAACAQEKNFACEATEAEFMQECGPSLQAMQQKCFIACSGG